MDSLTICIIGFILFAIIVWEDQKRTRTFLSHEFPSEPSVSEEEKQSIDEYSFRRQKMLREVVYALPIDQHNLFRIFCETYADVNRSELLYLLRSLAQKKRSIGELHYDVFLKLSHGYRKISKEEIQEIFSLYSDYLTGNELNPIVDFLSSFEKQSVVKVKRIKQESKNPS